MSSFAKYRCSCFEWKSSVNHHHQLLFHLITNITLGSQCPKLKRLKQKITSFSSFWRQSYRDSQNVRSVLQRRYFVSTMIQLLFSDKGATTTFVDANLHTWQLKSHIGGDNMCTGRKKFFSTSMQWLCDYRKWGKSHEASLGLWGVQNKDINMSSQGRVGQINWKCLFVVPKIHIYIL